MSKVSKFVSWFVRFIVNSIILSALLTIVLVYALGESEFTCEIDGQNVDGCEVYVGDEYIGSTPMTSRLYVGYHQIEVLPPKNIANIMQISWNGGLLTSGIGSDFKAAFTTMKASENTVFCTVDGKSVDGCQVEVNGRYVGETPLRINLEPGSHRIIVVAPDQPLTKEAEWVYALESQGAGTEMVASFTSENRY